MVKLRRKKNGDGENTPIGVDVKGQESVNKLLHIRTCPPTPQCFSAGQGHSTASTPKPSRIRPPLNQERARLQDVKEMNKEINRVAAEKDARSLDVFWFLKPCTLSS
ncbi:Unknown protein [Striga hermonthica]|uniref:Uncharacterized protein n=1 Tax=Striga hermonthica TaxID=68872 RepID=A0A9N7MXA0_STRHE|nr:Unknown protein [Striga hermonthica]